MVSLRRRQVMIGGLAGVVAPAISLASETPERLVLSGRVLGRNGKPLAGAAFTAAGQRITTDADGRFMLVTNTRAAGAFASNARRDDEGTWRATVGLRAS